MPCGRTVISGDVGKYKIRLAADCDVPDLLKTDWKRFHGRGK